MRFRILGPLEIEGITESDPFRQRTLLAMLLLEANKVVSVERLIKAIWGDAPPNTARAQIQICVSALRRVLGSVGLLEVIVTRAPGYVLQIDDEEIDLRVFDHLVAAGRAARETQCLADAADLLRQALALWRGPALADIDSRLVQSTTTQLAEQRLHVLEECIDVELQLDRHHELIGELMGLVAENPLRERLRAQLMTALYRAGRQAEALEAYRDARETLIEELGLEPGEDLRQLQQAVLAGDLEPAALAEPGPSGPGPSGPASSGPASSGPASSGPASSGPASSELAQAELAPAELAPSRYAPAEAAREVTAQPVMAPVLPRLLPGEVTDCVGQEDLVEELTAHLAPTADETPPKMKVVAISGMGGVGKTTIAIRVAHRLAEHYPDGQLYAELRSGDGHVTSPERVLERFLHALGVARTAISSDLAERKEIFRDRLADRRVLILLDDAAGEEQIRPLLPSSPYCAVIVTSRSRLAGLPGARQIAVDVPSKDQAVVMLANMVGWERVHTEPSQALRLVGLCANLPLALRVAGARLNARPHWTIEQLNDRLANEEGRLDELSYAGQGIRASIGFSYESLSRRGRQLFCRLALLEMPDFPAWITASLLDCDLDTAEAVLEDLVDAQLVGVRQRAGGSRTRYGFHDLIRVYARERLMQDETEADRVAALGRVLSTWLFLSDEAHRREYGGDFTLLHGNAARRPLPADLVDRLMSRPLDWWETERLGLVTAIRQAAAIGADEVCWDLAMSMVTIFEARGYYDDWRETHEIALAATVRQRNRRGEAAMLYSYGSMSLCQQRRDESAAHLMSAIRMFDELGESHGSALALRNLAFLDRTAGRLDEALTKYEKAAAVLREVGDLAGVAHILRSISQISLERHDYATAANSCEQALQIARSIGSQRLMAQVLALNGEISLDCGDSLRAVETFNQVLHLTRTAGDQLGEVQALLGLGTALTRQGDFEPADNTLRQAHSLAQRSGERLATARVCMALGEHNLAQGNRHGALGMVAEAVKLFEQLGASRGQRQAFDLLTQIRRDEWSGASPGPAESSVHRQAIDAHPVAVPAPS